MFAPYARCLRIYCELQTFSGGGGDTQSQQVDQATDRISFLAFDLFSLWDRSWLPNHWLGLSPMPVLIGPFLF